MSPHPAPPVSHQKFEQPCFFSAIEERCVRRPVGADVRHHLDLKAVHQAVALSAARTAGSRRAGGYIGNHLGVAAVFLVGLDLDAVGRTHATKHVRDQLEQRQFKSGFRMQDHGRPKRYARSVLRS